MTQEQQVNAIDWLVEQIKQNIDMDPYDLIEVKYKAKTMYYTELHSEFKRGLDQGVDIGKRIWSK